MKPSSLSRVCAFVSARNSTFTYKGRAVDITRVGRELGVRYVLEGSVRKAGDRVRITAQLIEAASGNHLWAERYDRKLVDIFDLQDEIQQAIVAAVEPEMASAEYKRAARKTPQKLDIWDLFQRASWHFNQRTPEDTDLAEPLFEKVAALDPSFALAYSMHAWLLHNAVVYGYRTDKEEQLQSAVALARTGVLHDDRDAVTHFALGRVLTLSGDISGGIREQRLAVELNPNFAIAAWGLGEALGRAGEYEESIQSIEVALRLSPRDPLRFLFMMFKGISLDAIGQTAAAETAYRESVALNQKVFTFAPNLLLMHFLVRQDRVNDARGVMDELLNIRPDMTMETASTMWDGLTAYSWLSDEHAWRESLTIAGMPG